MPGPKLPGAIDPVPGLQFSDKERLTAGLCQLLPCLPLRAGMVIWGVVDGILMFTNKRFTDPYGRVLR